MFQFVAVQPTYLPGTPFPVTQKFEETLDASGIPPFTTPFTMHPNLQAQPGLTPTAPRQPQNDSQQTQKIFRLAEENHGNNMNNSFEMFRKVCTGFFKLCF